MNSAMSALVLAVSAAMLGGAYAFEYVGGLQPCKLCLYQRVPWWAAICLGLLALLLASKPKVRAGLLVIAAVAVFIGAGIGMYHTGVEQKWWAGPTSCSGGAAPADLDALRNMIMNAPVVRCDEIPWSLFGISMAGYNFIISLLLGSGILWTVWRSGRAI